MQAYFNWLWNGQHISDFYVFTVVYGFVNNEKDNLFSTFFVLFNAFISVVSFVVNMLHGKGFEIEKVNINYGTAANIFNLHRFIKDWRNTFFFK